MKKESVKITSEVFRVHGEEFDTVREAVYHAYKVLQENNYHGMSIDRVTKHDPVDVGLFMQIPQTEVVTGSFWVPGVPEAQFSVGLSRYSPVGGGMPIEIEIEVVE